MPIIRCGCGLSAILLDEEDDVDDSRKICCATSPHYDVGSSCERYSLLAEVNQLTMSSGTSDARVQP